MELHLTAIRINTSHVVTFHPTQVNTPRFKPSQTCWYVLNLLTPEGRKAELTLVTCYIPRRFTRLQTVTHPSTNRTECRLTTLIEANALTTTLVYMYAATSRLLPALPSFSYSSALSSTFISSFSVPLGSKWRSGRALGVSYRAVRGGSRKKYWGGGWPLIIWETATSRTAVSNCPVLSNLCTVITLKIWGPGQYLGGLCPLDPT